MAAIVYLDPDDEITTAAARIRQATDPRVAIVIPFGSRVATSRINFRLLAREAMANGRRLDIVAPDASARALAASAGLPVFGSVGEYEDALEGSAAAGQPATDSPPAGGLTGQPTRSGRPAAPTADPAPGAGTADAPRRIKADRRAASRPARASGGGGRHHGPDGGPSGGSRGGARRDRPAQPRGAGGPALPQASGRRSRGWRPDPAGRARRRRRGRVPVPAGGRHHHCAAGGGGRSGGPRRHGGSAATAVDADRPRDPRPGGGVPGRGLRGVPGHRQARRVLPRDGRGSLAELRSIGLVHHRGRDGRQDAGWHRVHHRRGRVSARRPDHGQRVGADDPVPDNRRRGHGGQAGAGRQRRRRTDQGRAGTLRPEPGHRDQPRSDDRWDPQGVHPDLAQGRRRRPGHAGRRSAGAVRGTGGRPDRDPVPGRRCSRRTADAGRSDAHGRSCRRLVERGGRDVPAGD